MLKLKFITSGMYSKRVNTTGGFEQHEILGQSLKLTASYTSILIIILKVNDNEKYRTPYHGHYYYYYYFTLIQGIYNYVPQTHHFSSVRTAAPILQLQFMLHAMLFPMLNVSALLH